MQVALTGASGFIGSHIARALHAAGHRVTALVRPTSEQRHVADVVDRFDDHHVAQLGDRWLQPNHADYITIHGATNRLQIAAPPALFDHHTPALLRHRYGQRFEAVFSVEASMESSFHFVFGAEDQDHFSDILITLMDIGGNDRVVNIEGGGKVLDGAFRQPVTGSGDPAAAATVTDTIWVRVHSDGSDVTAEIIVGGGEPTDWSNPDTTWTKSNFGHQGGMIGFRQSSPPFGGIAFIDRLTVRTDTNDDGTYDTTDLVETFELDGSGFHAQDMAHDAAGNLTYDGLHGYTYDAWNRLVAIHRAHRDPDNNDALEFGADVEAYRYDGLGRRITRELTHAPRPIHKEYVYAGQSVVHVRMSNTFPVRQMIWAGTFGTGYIDELIQVGMGNPIDLGFYSIDEFFWPVLNANFNVMAIVDEDGLLVERYEYTPYGQRQIYRSAGIHDPHAMSPRALSPQWEWTGFFPTTWNYTINPVGHQGLFHDGTGSATGGGVAGGGLIQQGGGRVWHAALGQHLQRTVLSGGSNLYRTARFSSAQAGSSRGNCEPYRPGYIAGGPDDPHYYQGHPISARITQLRFRVL